MAERVPGHFRREGDNGVPGAEMCAEKGSMEESAAWRRGTGRQPRFLWRRSAAAHPRDPAPGKRGDSDDFGEDGHPASGLRQAWRLLRFGLMRAAVPMHDLTGQPVRARAFLESAKVEEKYYYHQHISANPFIKEINAPSGTIKFVLPYDGEKYFTRAARRDVERGLAAGATADETALVGFLALTGYTDTDLGKRLDLDEKNGTLSVTADFPAGVADDAPDPLLAGGASGVITHEYRPNSQRVIAAQVQLELHDPDTTGILGIPRTIAEGYYEGIVRQASFKPELTLGLRVSVALPRTAADGAKATVSGVFIQWPARPSQKSLRLSVSGQKVPLRYNPERERRGGLEWFDVEMEAEKERAGGGTREFVSPWMDLSIIEPGDLYRWDSIDGEVKITVNRLLSGTDARLFDATGQKARKPRLRLASTVSVKFSLTLGDTFTRRRRSPHQQMHFAEVLPEEARIDDVSTALQNQGFEVFRLTETKARESPVGSDAGTQVWWLRAERPHGADTFQILLCVEGRRFRTRRQRPVEGGGAYHTTMESGDLDIYAYGSLRSDSKTVVREMNALRRTLRGRFERLPARR